MLLGFWSLGSWFLLGFYNLRKLVSHGTDYQEFFTAKCPTGGANVNELNDGSDVVDFDGGFGLFGVHVF
jgi:hypothetical protein